MLDLEELKRLHDKAYNSGQVTRERASDDMVFYYVTHWDDNMLAESQLAYRGEFDVLKKAGRQILSDLAANPIQVDFDPKDETRDDAAETMDGMYRADDNSNISIEAYGNGKREAVVCGVGAWELCTEYLSLGGENKDQVIKRRPITEANNNLLWDPNSKFLDRSDANYCSLLTAYSEDGYKDLVHDLTGEELETVSVESFKHPEHSYSFPWISGEGKKIYVVSFYHRKKVKKKILTFVDPFGEVSTMYEDDLAEVEDDMMDQGFEFESEKEIETWEVTKYIASGEKILDSKVIAGENIPVVPVYGEYAIVEGEVHYEGVTRCAKDPQRLRNFQMSYLADISARSPRPKPIYYPEQIQGFEGMYAETGADDNYPYRLMNKKDGTGTDLPLGPIGVTPEQPIPQSLVACIELSRQAVEDVANPGIPQDIADPDLSGKAVIAIQNRLDQQSMIYQEHYKHAKRRDAEIYVSMSKEVYDVPRKVRVELPDGKKKTVELMQTVVDAQTGDIVTINDINSAEFDVYSKIGQSYSTQKEQTIDRLETMAQSMDPGDPIRKVLQLKALALMDGDFDDVRDYVNRQLLIMGIKQPETPEEEQMLQAESQKAQEPSAEMVLAMAEDKKGQAQLLAEQRQGIDMQLKAENEKMKRQIDMFEAQTDRMDTQVDAQEAGANINFKNIDAFGKQIDNMQKMKELRTPAEMTDDELFQQLGA